MLTELWSNDRSFAQRLDPKRETRNGFAAANQETDAQRQTRELIR